MKRGYSLQSVPYESNTHMVSLFLNGHVDVTAQSSITMFPVESRAPGLFKFIYGQYNNSMFFVVPTEFAGPDLASVKGRTVYTWQSPSAELVIKLILGRYKLLGDGTDYDIKGVPAKDLGVLLHQPNGQVGFVFDSIAAKLVSSGRYKYLEERAIDHVISPDKPTPFFNGGAMIRSEIIAEHPEKAKAIRAAFIEAVDIIRNDPVRIRSLLSRRLGLSGPEVDALRSDVYGLPNPEMLERAHQTYEVLRKHDPKLLPLDVSALFWSPIEK